MSAYVPDLHFFFGRGAKDILPLYRDSRASQPNLHPRLLRLLAQKLNRSIPVADFTAYLYGTLAHPGYTDTFHPELENRQIRVPITIDPELFDKMAGLGRRLIYLHSYGERASENQKWPQGTARCVKAVPAGGLPETFDYDDDSKTLSVGGGEFAPVEKAVWEFEVSGLKVVQSWLGYRMKNRKGKKTSPLDDIVPDDWPPEFTSELLCLLHLLEETLEIHKRQAEVFSAILAGPLLLADELGPVPDSYRKAPVRSDSQHTLEL